MHTELFYSKGREVSFPFLEIFLRVRKRILENIIDARKIRRVAHHGASVLVAKKYATTKIPIP